MLEKGQNLGIDRCYISGYVSDLPNVHTVFDVYPDRGPLGGIHACMKEMLTPYCLVLPTDSPTLPLEILDALLTEHQAMRDKDAVLMWEHGDRKEPLIAIYPVAMASVIEELIRSEAAPVFRALDQWRWTCFRMELQADVIININTPELYQKVLSQNKNL